MTDNAAVQDCCTRSRRRTITSSVASSLGHKPRDPHVTNKPPETGSPGELRDEEFRDGATRGRAKELGLTCSLTEAEASRRQRKTCGDAFPRIDRPNHDKRPNSNKTIASQDVRIASSGPRIATVRVEMRMHTGSRRRRRQTRGPAT